MGSLVVCGANRHDVSQLEALLNAVIARELHPAQEQHLLADNGYIGVKANDAMCDRGYVRCRRAGRSEGVDVCR